MTTLGDIKTRIITETNRDDLADDLAPTLQLVIQRAIEFYASTRFWFNEGRVTGVCVVGNEYVAWPTGMRLLDKAFIVVGGTRYDLEPRSPVEIEDLYTTPMTGQPTDYAAFGSNAWLWPTPNVAYPLIWIGVTDVTALDYSDTASANAWTNNAPDLITARAKIMLYRDVLSAMETDPRLALAMAQEKDAKDNLQGETNRRLSKGRVRSSW